MATLPGTVVTMAAHRDLLAVAYHHGIGEFVKVSVLFLFVQQPDYKLPLGQISSSCYSGCIYMRVFNPGGG